MNKQTFKVMLSASENQQNEKIKSIWLQRDLLVPAAASVLYPGWFSPKLH